MDWLTEEWTRKVAEKAHDKWTYLYHERKEPCVERQYVADFIARAAVREESLNMIGRGEAGLAALPEGEQGFWKGYWQALIDRGHSLKAAVEGE